MLIEIDGEVMVELKRRAEPFVDTPNSVLRRVLQIDLAAHAPAVSDGPEQAGQTLAERRVNSRSGRRRRPVAKRTTSGDLLPEDQYIDPLLLTLHRSGGRAPYRDMTTEIGALLADVLTETDRATIKSGAIRWQNRLKFVRLRLIERGLLKRDSPRGMWELTAAGVDAAFEVAEASAPRPSI